MSRKTNEIINDINNIINLKQAKDILEKWLHKYDLDILKNEDKNLYDLCEETGNFLYSEVPSRLKSVVLLMNKISRNLNNENNKLTLDEIDKCIEELLLIIKKHESSL